MRDTLTSAATAVLGLLAVGFAAATLTTTSDSGPAGGGGGGGSEGVIPIPPPQEVPRNPLEIPYVEYIFLAVVLVLAGLLVYTAIFRRQLFKQVIAAAVPFVLAILVVIGIIMLLGGGGAPGSGGEPGFPGEGTAGPGPPGSGDGVSDDADSSSSLPLGLLAVVGIVLAGAALLVWQVRDGGADPEVVDEAADDGAAAAVGRAAGRAADRIEDADSVDNEVYRAWREMTDPLDVEDPETSTPGEFATAAVDAGLERSDVDELTRLFEEVRYGDAPPDEYEDRAGVVLRRVETQYAEREDAEEGT